MKGIILSIIIAITTTVTGSANNLQDFGSNIQTTEIVSNCEQQKETEPAEIKEIQWPIGEVDIERFFFIPLETGSVLKSTYTPYVVREDEVCIGVLGTTTTPYYSGIQELCKDLAKSDSEFAGMLTPFASWTNNMVIEDIKSENSQIAASFETLNQTDHERFLTLQLTVAEAKLQEIARKKECSWILERDSALIGYYYSLLMLAPYNDWESVMCDKGADLQNLFALYVNSVKWSEKTSMPEAYEKMLNQKFRIALDLLCDKIDHTDINAMMIE